GDGTETGAADAGIDADGIEDAEEDPESGLSNGDVADEMKVLMRCSRVSRRERRLTTADLVVGLWGLWGGGVGEEIGLDIDVEFDIGVVCGICGEDGGENAAGGGEAIGGNGDADECADKDDDEDDDWVRFVVGAFGPSFPRLEFLGRYDPSSPGSSNSVKTLSIFFLVLSDTSFLFLRSPIPPFPPPLLNGDNGGERGESGESGDRAKTGDCTKSNPTSPSPSFKSLLPINRASNPTSTRTPKAIIASIKFGSSIWLFKKDSRRE
ncbi:hypothetical protein HK102_009338, partial [Quaeritorhiza haematococci]